MSKSSHRLLVIGLVWPEPKSSAAGSRMLQLLEQFQYQGYQITFASAAKRSERSFDLSQMNIKVRRIELNEASFDDFIVKLKPDVVLFDRFMTEEQYGWRIAEKCPKTLLILDTEDFHGLRKAREVALKQKTEVSLSLLQNDLTKREIASMYRCDLSFMISEAEIELLISRFQMDKHLLYYLPFLIDPLHHQLSLPEFNKRQHFVAIGNFIHAPNYDAVLYLKQVLWPLIRKQLPQTELHIYGAYASQKVDQLHNIKEGFIIKGFADDANLVLQNAKVCLAPLRFGAGLKGKLIDSLRNGTPCLMSTVAAEGMFGSLEPNGFITDCPETFVEKAVQLYSETKVWQEKQDHGYNVLRKRFNKSEFAPQFKSRIETLQSTLEKHRQNNFIGQLLRHHTLQSTKYLSKWIELKNK